MLRYNPFSFFRPMFLCMTMVFGCNSDNEEDLKPTGQQPTDCPTAQVTYGQTVKPILQQKCYSCHSNGLMEGNVSLDDYAQVKKHASSGQLMGVISHAQGFIQMPFNAAKLPACDIAKIKAWVDAGAPNN